MIFVTVGTELPFDRMMRIVDQWAAETGRHDVFAQIGETDWRPRYMRYSKFLEPSEFVSRFSSAKMIVAHAGMGTVLSALQFQKPILVIPRLAALGEQRNDHQLATARRLAELGKVTVAFDGTDLRTKLDEFDTLPVAPPIGPYAQPELISVIRDAIYRARLDSRELRRTGTREPVKRVEPQR